MMRTGMMDFVRKAAGPVGRAGPERDVAKARPSPEREGGRARAAGERRTELPHRLPGCPEGWWRWCFRRTDEELAELLEGFERCDVLNEEEAMAYGQVLLEVADRWRAGKG